MHMAGPPPNPGRLAHPRHLPRRSPALLPWLLMASLSTLAGCSTPPTPPAATAVTNTPQPVDHYWSGRLALHSQNNHIDPQDTHTFSASFTLQGTPEQGSLDILSPFGTHIAHLQWSAGTAQLHQGGHTWHANSLHQLLRDTLGHDLPIPALFDWLRGTPAHITGWQADLRLHAQGRITAERTPPAPPATLRIILNPAR